MYTALDSAHNHQRNILCERLDFISRKWRYFNVSEQPSPTRALIMTC